MTVNGDRLTSIEVRGMRCLSAVQIDLKPLLVLIGANGTGKSTLIEACELLRAASAPGFSSRFLSIHGGFGLLRRAGASELQLGIRARGPKGDLSYGFALSEGRSGAVVVTREWLDLGPLPGHDEPLHVITRDDKSAWAFDQTQGKPIELTLAPDQLVLTAFGLHPPQAAFPRVIALLERIEVHLPFECLPYWAAQERGHEVATRSVNVIQPTVRLARFGANLANAYHALKTDFSTEHWFETLDLLRLGLGQELEDVKNPAALSGGRLGLSVKWRGVAEAIPAHGLSDGILSFLALVAAVRLAEARGASLFAFDEPEVHLHPELLLRVLTFFERLSLRCPVLLSTHSDALLDGLEDPASSTLVLEAEHSSTQVLSLDPPRLKSWLERYRGLGDIRGAGNLSQVLAE